MFAVATFYRFMPFADLPALRDALQALGDTHGLKGTLLLAPEGFNATLAGAPAALDAGLDRLRGLLGCPTLAVRRSACATMPFGRLKVRVKPEIVTLRVPGVDPARRTGTRVAPAAWNMLLRDPAVPVIDVRNGFEHALGTFAGAIDPATRSFGDFPAFVRSTLDPARNRAVAMFCTGGIRCEKASAYLLDQGFGTVFQLDGGILAYLDAVPAAESLWRGACFVFDGRETLGAGLVPHGPATSPGAA